MKVICIDSRWSKTEGVCPMKDEIYTVINATYSNGNILYVFKEVPLGINGVFTWWDARGFILLDHYKNSQLRNELSPMNFFCDEE